MLAFILSQPRSGSTVLSTLLDRRKGIVVMPESNFPQVLGHLSREERKDKAWMAALYRGSTLPPRPRPPTPLSVTDAMTCMNGSNADILFSLGKAMAGKLNRDPDDVKLVLWKTVRMVGMLSGPLSTGGKFIVLRRNPVNVFDSQFRVAFGIKNRNPWRYSIFLQSYENVFARIPDGIKYEVNYDEVPETIPDICRFAGIQANACWESRASSIDIVADTAPWLNEANKEFRNTDREKRGRLDPAMVRRLEFALKVTRLLRPFMKTVRDYYDRKSLQAAREDAAWLRENDPESGYPKPISTQRI